MKSEDLYHAVTDLRDDQILEGEKKLKNNRPRRMVWLGGIAAALALVILAGIIAVPRLTRRNETDAAPGETVLMTSPEQSQSTDSTAPKPTGSTVPQPTEAGHSGTSDPKLYNLAAPSIPVMAQYPTDELWEREGYEAYEAAYSAWRESRDALRPETNYADGLAPFLAATIPTFLGGAEGENRIYSPMNVYMALAMLTETAGGNTRQELLNLLGETDIEAVRTRARDLWKANYSDDGRLTCLLANSFWMRDDANYNPETLSRLANDYYASSNAGPVGDAAYNAAIHQWINDNTGGLLQEQANGVNTDLDTVLLLISTIYYKASWAGEFFEGNNEILPFHSVTGDEDVTFMRQTMEEHAVYFSDNFSATCKSLNDSGGMFFLLPDEGVTPEDLLNDPDALAFIGSQERRNATTSRQYKVNFSVPKFDVSSDIDLREGMQALGVHDAFDSFVSDFTPLTEEIEQLFVSEVKHAARVKIDEEGCEAAAFTSIEVAMEAIPEEMEELDFTLDRPFLFVVTNNEGLPLFVGTVNHPAE